MLYCEIVEQVKMLGSAEWREFEPGSDRVARFEVLAGWNVPGRWLVKVRLPRVLPNPYGGPAWYMGTAFFNVAEGASDYSRARVSAMYEAYQTRRESEGL